MFHPYRNMHPYYPKEELHNQSFFRKCVFETDNNYDYYYPPDKHVVLQEVKGIDFKACEFAGSDPTDKHYKSDKERGYGIYSLGSYFTINDYCNSQINPCPDTCLQNCTFSDLKYGIYAIDWTETDFVSINHASFSNNLRSIYLSGLLYPELTLNTISTRNAGYGIYLDRCNAYKIEENLINGDSLGFNISSIGMYVNNSGYESNEIYKNEINNQKYAIIAEGINRHSLDSTGLCIKCNTFDNCEFDISVVADTLYNNQGIAPAQGNNSTDPEDMAGNLLYIPDPTPDGDYDDINNAGEHITYYYPSNASGYEVRIKPIDITEETVTPYEVIFVNWNLENGCPSNLNQGGSIDELKISLLITEEKVDSTENVLYALIDGGDTDDLQEDVEYSNPQESMDIYNSLMNESPYLSDTVVSTAMEKEDVLPNTMIRDIMVANPNTAKSTKLIDKIDERYEPMPTSMKDQILSGKSLISEREETETDLSMLKNNKAYLFNNIIRYYRKDTINGLFGSDTIIYMYKKLNQLWAKYALAFEYLNKYDSANAIATIDSIPMLFKLSTRQLTSHQIFEDYFDVLSGFVKQDKTIFQADSVQKALLSSIYYSASGNEKVLLRNLLIAIDSLDYNESFILPCSFKTTNGYIKQPDELDVKDIYHLRIYPNPSKDYIILEYLNDLDKPVLVCITDLSGKLITSFTLNKSRDQRIVDTRNWKAGVYIATLKINDNDMESMKLIITK